MKSIVTIILTLIGIYDIFAQGFVNLDFESANLSGYSAGPVPAADAIPGWTTYYSGGISSTNISYDAGGLIEIVGANTIQGNYYMELSGDRGFTASIGQTGTISADAQSLTFWGNIGVGSVSFNGQTLLLTVLGQTANYNIYGASISAFAGQTGQLVFTSGNNPFVAGLTIDNIQFTSLSIPEPSVEMLSGFGGILLFGFLSRRDGKCKS